MRLSKSMLTILIILIIEARTFIHMNSVQQVVITAPKTTNVIQSSVTGGTIQDLLSDSAQQTGPLLQDLTLTNSLTVLGDSLLGKTSVAGGIIVDGDISLSKSGLQSLSGPLYLQQNRLAAVDFMGGALRINTDGTIAIPGTLGVNTLVPYFNNLTVDLTHSASPAAAFGSFIIKGTDSASISFDSSGSAYISGNIEASGTGSFSKVTTQTLETKNLIVKAAGDSTIPAGKTAMKVLSNNLSSTSRVFVTPLTRGSLPIAVTQLSPSVGLSEGFFTVEVPAPSATTLDFTWFIIN